MYAQLTCYKCGQVGHLARTCTNVPTSTPPSTTPQLPSASQTLPIGYWPNGRPKYHCPYHGREVGHPPETCFLRTPRPGGTPSAPPVSLPLGIPHPTTSQPIRQIVLETFAQLNPERGEELLTASIPHGIRLQFGRPTTAQDATTLRGAFPSVTSCYPIQHLLLLGFPTREIRDEILTRFTGIQDGTHTLTYSPFDTVSTPPHAPLNFQSPSPSPSLGTQATPPIIPSIVSMDTDLVRTAPDESIVATTDASRITRIETSVHTLAQQVGTISTRIDSLTAVVESITPTPPELMQFTTGFMPAEDMISGAVAWGVWRSRPTAPWQSQRLMITETQPPRWRGLAVTESNVPISTTPYEGLNTHLTSEDAAKNRV